MTGLKTYLPKLAWHLGSSPDQLNEWMRALAQKKLLQSKPGRGPGSGVTLDGKAVATMILAVLASEFRTEAVDLTKDLVKYVPVGGKKTCAFTGATNLRDAIASALERHIRLAGKVVLLTEIRLLRGRGNPVTLSWVHGGKKPQEQKFGPVDHYSPSEANLSPKKVTVSYELKTIHSIGNDVREVMPYDYGEAR